MARKTAMGKEPSKLRRVSPGIYRNSQGSLVTSTGGRLPRPAPQPSQGVVQGNMPNQLEGAAIGQVIPQPSDYERATPQQQRPSIQDLLRPKQGGQLSAALEGSNGNQQPGIATRPPAPNMPGMDFNPNPPTPSPENYMPGKASAPMTPEQFQMLMDYFRNQQQQPQQNGQKPPFVNYQG